MIYIIGIYQYSEALLAGGKSDRTRRAGARAKRAGGGAFAKTGTVGFKRVKPAGNGTETSSPTAKIFMSGRSQAVRLPKAFRFEGTEVRVSKVGDKVILEPMQKPPFDAKAFWARLDALGARDFPEVSDDDLRPELDDDVSFG
jgi:antitoxin VapB